jgi:hypothetical protein
VLSVLFGFVGRVLEVLVAWNFCIGHIQDFVVLLLCVCELLTASADFFCYQLTIVKSTFGVNYVGYLKISL